MPADRGANDSACGRAAGDQIARYRLAPRPVGVSDTGRLSRCASWEGVAASAAAAGPGLRVELSSQNPRPDVLTTHGVMVAGLRCSKPIPASGLQPAPTPHLAEDAVRPTEQRRHHPFLAGPPTEQPSLSRRLISLSVGSIAARPSASPGATGCRRAAACRWSLLVSGGRCVHEACGHWFTGHGSAG